VELSFERGVASPRRSALEKGICALTERISAGGTGEGKGRGHGRCCYRGSLFIALAVQLCFVLPQTVARKLTQWPVMPTNRS
jgi:hypothetical protein